MRVLVADDSATARRMLTLMLGKLGYEVIEAVNGQEALELLTGQDAPRLAILDWMMPRMDGDAVCRSLRSGPEPALTYIILVTAKDTPKDIVRGLESGADDYIPKPHNINELHARLRIGVRAIEQREELSTSRAELARWRSGRQPQVEVTPAPQPEIGEIYIPVL